MAEAEKTGLEIAVIGMAGRFPGAENIDQFWENLKNGVESITFYSEEELLQAGVEPDLLADPNYVKCGGGILEDKDCFDAAFFNYSPAEAEVMDPQMRIFHECTWHALEDAGYNPAAYDGLIGLFAGASFSMTWEALALSSGKLDTFGQFAGTLLIDRDYLCTRISYRLDLKGPAVVVKTACSTSLVAIHMACRSILTGECDMALAGGVTVTFFTKTGYIYREGLIGSRDGHCRAFDAAAKGTVSGNGVGIVLLKRLEDAVSDRDHIYAVIKGSAINNDGIRKAGFTTPSVEGQAEVIKTAQQAAEVEPGSIGYIEAHGTGTELGDPVEIEGLKLAFNTNKKNFCPIGSVKTNVGHLDSAAGVTSFIKAVLALEHKKIPPNINFESANPKIDFANSPFYVNAQLSEWRSEKYPLRAGISSFGIGGTNAHVILEEYKSEIRITKHETYSNHQNSNARNKTLSSKAFAGGQGGRFSRKEPPLSLEAESSASTYQLILLSAKSPAAIERSTQNLAAFLKDNPGIDLEDVAYTLQVGRKAFAYKKFLLCTNCEETIKILESPENEALSTFYSEEKSRSIVFMFPGQGAQYVNMGAGLYKTEPVFRREMDRCFEILKSIMDVDLKEVLYDNHASGGQGGAFRENCPPAPPAKAFVSGVGARRAVPSEFPSPGGVAVGRGGSDPPHHTDLINETSITQPLIFSIEYALAKLLMSWGITPYAMIGHSIGEYTAACLSGIFPLPDALQVTALRGRLMQGMPPGKMLSVSLPEEELRPLMSRDIFLAAINSSSHCVVSGTFENIERFAVKLKEMNVPCRPLHTSHAFHSGMMDPILTGFEEHVKKIRLNNPAMPYISNVTGQWISTAEAVAPGYWARHIRETVNFRDGLSRLLQEKDPLFIEVGPGNVLSTFLRQHKDKKVEHFVVNLLRHPREDTADDYYLLNKIGQLWLYGVDVDWQGFYADKQRYRLALPGYPFERRRFFIEAAADFRGMKTGKAWQEVDKPSAKVTTPLHTRPNLTKPYAAPRSDTERKLVRIWQNFFGFQNPGIDDDFFELGGDSLNASAIIARIHREFGVLIPLTELFNSPTIKKLSLYISRAAKTRYEEIRAAEKKEYYPLSPAQKRLFILREFEENNIAYNMPVVLSIEEDISKGKMAETFKKLICRHESFRTSFALINEEPVQRVHDQVDFEIEYYERTALLEPATCNSQPVTSTIKRFIRLFDFSRAPLLRVGLISGKGDLPAVLMVDIHHIITDGTSQVLLVRDFAALYSGAAQLPLRLRYTDYSQWLQSPETKHVLAGQEEFWLREFAEEVPVLNLPADFPRPPLQSFAGRLVQFELDSQETKKLKEIAHGENATLFMVLLAIYNILLAKLSGQEDIVVGTATAGRKHTDLEKIIGMFVNTLALRSFPNGEKSFILFLKELKEKTIKAFENDGFQFEDLLDKLEINRDMSRNPLFDVMFVIQNFYDASGAAGIAREERAESLKIRPYPYEQETAKFDLTLTASEQGERLLFRLEYCSLLFEPQTSERFISYFKNIAAAVTKDPGMKINAIEILSQEEKRHILVDFNDTISGYPRDRTIHGLFEDQAGQIPDNIALVFEGMALTYKELDKRATRVAAFLRAKGIAGDNIVGLLLERSAEMILGMFGILKAGAAYLPLDPSYPDERTGYMIADSDTVLLLTSSGFRKKAGTYCESFDLDDGDLYCGKQGEAVPCAGGPGSPAYVIYTSGSTGKPKGVVIEHRGICSLNGYHKEKFNITKRDKFIQFASISFDASVWEIYMALLNGAALYPLDEETVGSIEAFADYLNRHGITAALLPPEYAAYLHPGQLKCLRLLITGGSSPTLELVDRWRNKLLYINAYGPTETTICATCNRVEQGGELHRVSIGRPVNNTCIYITDSRMNIRPVGVAGELSIAGVGVGRGYLNRPELTAEKFVKAQAASFKPQARHGFHMSHTSYKSYLYKTGDLARWLPGGNIEFLGRMDSQVKIRGFRIELGEIQNLLTAHDKITAAVVAAHQAESTPGREEGNRESYLCAYIEAHEKLAAAELRDYLSKKLPAYMVPSYFKQVDRIPLTPAGKVDSRALASSGETLSPAVEYVPPGSEMEKKIAAVWQDILQADRVGIDDNFFDLGGNSLDIVRVNSRLKEVTHKSLPVVFMFKYPTIRSLAAYCSQPGEENISAKIDRSAALEKGERDRNIRRQMRKTSKGEK